MFAFLRSLFSSKGIPSTSEYEKKLFEMEAKYAAFLEIQESSNFKRYLELKEYVTSPHFTTELNKIKALSYANSHEALSIRRCKELKKTKEVKKYNKHGEGLDDVKVQEYLQLQREINEPSFQNQVEYLKNKKRHKNSDPYKCQLEFKDLEKSESVKQYFKLQKKYSALFKEQELWVSKLYDNFDKDGVDQNRWLLKPFWGEQLLNSNAYAMEGDLQLPLEKNVSQHGGVLRLSTLAEEAQGLAWDSKMGFIPRLFNYTSGMASTALSFRQLYGRFEAKIKVKRLEGLYHAFWMGTDAIVPHLNMIKFEGKRAFVSLYTQEKNIEQELSYRLTDDYYIYTLLWDDKKIVWQINGVKVMESPNTINEPLYVAFSSGVREAITMPHELYFEVDWVRCFRKNK